MARSARVSAAVGTQPVLARVREGHRVVFVLRGRLGRRARRAERLARAVYRDVSRRFTGPSRAAQPVEVCLFSSARAYNRFVLSAFGPGDHSPLGFYAPRARLVVANLSRGVGNLRHELVHPLVGDDFARVPAWVNEGLGSLYGTSRPRKGRFQFLVNYRLRHVKAALRRGNLPTLAAMAASGRREIYGARSMTYYGTARYLLLYLDRRGLLERFYGQLKRLRPPSGAAQLALLRRHVDYRRFVSWARRLRRAR